MPPWGGKKGRMDCKGEERKMQGERAWYFGFCNEVAYSLAPRGTWVGSCLNFSTSPCYLSSFTLMQSRLFHWDSAFPLLVTFWPYGYLVSLMEDLICLKSFSPFQILPSVQATSGLTWVAHPLLPPLSKLLDFSVGTIFIFTSVQPLFPNGYILDHPRGLHPLWSLRL